MQLLFEAMILRKGRKDTLVHMMLYLTIAAELSFTILNIANIMQIKWLAILAAIDLIYFVCVKVCGWGFLFVMMVAMAGIKYAYYEFFKRKYGIDDVEKILK